MAKMTVSNSKPIEIFRKNARGQVEAQEVRFSDWKNLPRQGSYVLRIIGVGDPYEDNSGRFGKRTKMRLECQVVDGRESEIGKIFCDSLTYSNAEGATLGQIMRAVWGPLETGVEIDTVDLLDGEFEAIVKVSADGEWASIAHKTAAPPPEDESPAPPPRRPAQRRPQRAAEDDDPYEEDVA